MMHTQILRRGKRVSDSVTVNGPACNHSDKTIVTVIISSQIFIYNQCLKYWSDIRHFPTKTGVEG